jgi:hypothetical protein
MSVLVTALVVGCGVVLGRLIAQAPRVRGGKPVPAVSQPAHDMPAADAPPTLEGFPCQLGDVVLRSMGDEAWLAGALVLSETRGADSTPVAVLFVSPEAGAMRAVLARPQSESLTWLTEVKDAVVVAGEPATALEIAGERYERQRRLPLRVDRRGSGAPEVGQDVIFAEYAGLSDTALVVLVAKDKVVAFRGEVLPRGAYDVLPGKENE